MMSVTVWQHVNINSFPTELGSCRQQKENSLYMNGPWFLKDDITAEFLEKKLFFLYFVHQKASASANTNK